MSSAATATAEQPSLAEQSLPNKFIYPEFAGFAGEKYLKEILRQILSIALYRTWEIFVDNQAYDNDCFMSVERVATKLQRAEKTIQANLSEFAAKKLLELRSGRKIFVQGERTYSRPVVIKDFTGLYTLAHEYDQWCQDAQNYVEPHRAYATMIKDDPRLEAKLRRFNNYRRILYTQPTGPEAALMLEARWFQDFEVDREVDRAEVENTRPICPKKLPKKHPEQNRETGQNESNEKAYDNSRSEDSFDSARNREIGGEASATPNSSNVPVARDYTKQVREYETGTHPSSESKTNLVPSSQKNVPPGVGKTRESAETHPDVRMARSAMEASGIEPGGAHRRADALPLPPKHPLARSFVHEVAGLFGDLNEKGSKTGIERKIESFELASADVLLCLVRAYVVARDTKDEKIRHRRPDGLANHMPLFCTMFGRFAQALGPGSKWQYTWQQMLEDIAADDRLSLWLSEHQADLAAGVSDQVETTEGSSSAQPVAATEATAGAEALAPEVPDEGWEQQEEAYGCADYLAGELAANNYEGVVIQVKVPKGGTHLQILVFPEQGQGYRLVCEEDVAALVAMARSGTLFADPEMSDDQAKAGD